MCEENQSIEEQYGVGDVFYAYFYFTEDSQKGKKRPVVVMQNEEDETWKAFKITSRIDKKLNHKYGYLLRDWKEAGLDKPSIIKCDRENIVDIEPKNIIKKLGNLSETDLKGLFVKLLKVKDMEYRREQQKNQER